MARDQDRQYEGRWEARLRKVGVSVERLERLSDSSGDPDLTLYEVRIKLDADEGTSVLIILKALEGDRPVVGFVGGAEMSSALISAAGKLEAGTVRWREDRPWGS